MKKSLFALPVLAIAFAMASCGRPNQQEAVSQDNTKDTMDYSVTALSPTGDTLWTAVADDIRMPGRVYYIDRDDVRVPNTVGPSGIYVTDKVTGQQFGAGTANYSIKSIPAVTVGK